MENELKKSTGLRRRPASPTSTSLPSLSGTEPPYSRSSSFSDFNDEQLASIDPTKNKRQQQLSILSTVSFIADPKRRLSRQSSLSWGHKPSPIIGASCLTFLFPIPILLQVEAHVSAFFLAAVTVTSFLSDHCYTGLESCWHIIDRILAPIAFISNVFSVYSNCGFTWASSSILAVGCHLLANHYSKRGIYKHFVIWHSLWHVVGSSLILFCHVMNSNYDAGSS